MVSIDVDGDRLVVTMRGVHALLALERRISVPLDAVRGATADPGMRLDRASVRAPGTRLPGVVTAGTYRKGGEQEFWNVRDASGTVVVELADDQRYRRLVVEVADPRETVGRVERALDARADPPA